MPLIDTFIQKWLGPTGLMVMFGTIVWGVQLNIGYVSLAKGFEVAQEERKTLIRQHQEMLITLEKMQIALEVTAKVADQAAAYGPRHDAAALEWKLRIERNQASCEECDKRLDRIQERVNRLNGQVQ